MVVADAENHRSMTPRSLSLTTPTSSWCRVAPGGRVTVAREGRGRARRGNPSATLLVNGGEIAYADVLGSLDHGRPVVVLAGTGRTADAIAAALSTPDADSRAIHIARSALTRIVPVDDVDAVRAAVATGLG